MKLGLKGLTSAEIIGIIVAVIAAVIILYILWVKGMLPFSAGANEAECTAYFIRGCQSGQKFDDTIKNIVCSGFGKSQFKTTYDKCFPGLGGQANCESFCTEILGV
jgi:hypothetical protein